MLFSSLFRRTIDRTYIRFIWDWMWQCDTLWCERMCGWARMRQFFSIVKIFNVPGKYNLVFVQQISFDLHSIPDDAKTNLCVWWQCRAQTLMSHASERECGTKWNKKMRSINHINQIPTTRHKREHEVEIIKIWRVHSNPQRKNRKQIF